MSTQQFTVTTETAGAVLGTLRKHVQNLPWSAARKHMEGRRISVNGILCVDEGRRVVAGDVIELRRQPLPPPPRDEDIRILHLDEHLVVVDKPAGMLSLRHPGDVSWRQERKDRQPSLEECLHRLIARRRGASSQLQSNQLLAVHRIDRETSGILVFACTEKAQQGLIEQFSAHTAMRKYLCVIPGNLPAQTIESYQIRDRGDGLRGSSDHPSDGQRMVTHIRPLRQLGEYSEMECRLETGRTNQIRIHLAEKSHPICGDVKYRGPAGQLPIADLSKAPRLALHATQLGFVHPVTQEAHDYQLPWPKDIQNLIRRLSASGGEVTEPSKGKNKKERS